MLALRLVRMIEANADELAEGLNQKLRTSERTRDFRKVPSEELKKAAGEVYTHLSDWLLTKTESDIELRFTRIGARRHKQGIPFDQFLWAMTMSKEHLWAFLQREAAMDRPLEIFGELELLRVLDQFFDRAVYYANHGYRQARGSRAA